MSARTDGELAAALEARLLAIEGVQTIFPERAAAETLLRLVGKEPSAPVRVQVADEGRRIVVRFSTRRTAPVRAVVAQAAAAVAELARDPAYRLELEFAHID